MFIFLTIIIIAISLSMDTFSLSLSYGMLYVTKNNQIKTSILVGLFHFFMPLLGNIFGNILVKSTFFDEDLLIGIVFLIISIELTFSLFKKEEIKPLKNIYNILLFSFVVSIDSFVTGVGLNALKYPSIITSFIFMIISSFFTYIGLSMGNNLHDKIGKKAEIIGIIIIFSLSILYLID